MRGVLLLLVVVATWWATRAYAQATALPIGIWAAFPNLPVKYEGESNAILTVRNATLAVIDGGYFKFYGLYETITGAKVQARFAGKAVCSDGDKERILISVDLSSCWTDGGAIPWFCDSAPTLYAGTFSFGVSLEGGLLINGWGGAQWPFVFACAGASLSSCQYSSSCNATANIQTLLYLYNSDVVLNGTQTVVFQAGSSTNNTIVIEGDTVTLSDSQVTLQQSNSSTSTTVNLGGTEVTNDITFVTQDSTFYNFYTTAPASCRNYATVTAARSTNLTLDTASLTRITFTSSSIEAPGSDWSLSPDASTLRYLGPSGQYGYALQGCLQLGSLYAPSSSGVAVALQLYNRTAGASSPLLGPPVQSTVFYNHTDPSLLTSVCAGVLLSGLYTDNLFGLYATLETVSGSYSTALGPSSFSLTATPLACKGEEINIKINATFNDTQLEAVRDCSNTKLQLGGAIWLPTIS